MTKVNNILVLLDEFELGLHPNWQKKSIKYITDFLKNIDKEFHLIITSHSPFLISDIPKQNIIFLDKDEKGNCVVVNGLKEKKQTFGANIHTLLSDSFFMEDGLMGEFAKGKINEVIEYLNGKKDTKIKNDDEAQVLEGRGGRMARRRGWFASFPKRSRSINLSSNNDDEVTPRTTTS